jgi:predicted acyltransferase
LLGYWALMTIVPVPGYGMGALALGDRSATLTAIIDRAVLGTDHIYAGTKTYDPEGLLSSMGAVATVMLGALAGRWIGTPRPLTERVAGLLAVGSIGMAFGLIWNWSFPINKEIWTSSYVVFTGGMACVVFGVCMWLIDVHGRTSWTKPFVIYGVNPIVAFVGSGLMARLIYSIITVEYRGREVAFQSAIYQAAFASWLPPKAASLGFAISFVLLWLGILWLLYRRRVFLKV